MGYIGVQGEIVVDGFLCSRISVMSSKELSRWRELTDGKGYVILMQLQWKIAEEKLCRSIEEAFKVVLTGP